MLEISDNDVEWQIWSQDNFDRETPRKVEESGVGLQEGLQELWIRHLYETVREDGLEGFYHFNLWLPRILVSIEIQGDWEGQVNLRNWVFDSRVPSTQHYSEAADEELLQEVAAAHLALILRRESCECLLDAAAKAETGEDFKKTSDGLTSKGE